MISNEAINSIKKLLPASCVSMDVPMAGMTSFRLGGPCEVLVEPENEEQLAAVSVFLRRERLPFFVLGNGTNTLVHDAGYAGVILLIGPKMSEVAVEGNVIRAQAGALLSRAASMAARSSLSGLEFAAGIPGSVGGAVTMNAGAFGGEMCQVIRHVRVIDDEGVIKDLSCEEMEFGYRHSLVHREPLIVTEVVMELQPGDPQEIRSKMDEFNARRREKQPLEYPSAGSTFKRPEGHFAGKLIMEAGMRGYQVGGARVSDKHCGFIVNTGKATTEDVLEVMGDVQQRVYERFGVKLEPEVVVL